MPTRPVSDGQPTATRFQPPPLRFPDALTWVLLRSFASPRPMTVDPRPAADLADRLLLTPRIAARTSADLLAAELGPQLASRFAAAHANTVAVQLQYRATCAMLSELAGELGVRLIVLKGMALQLTGVVPGGERPVADLDVLVPEVDAPRFQTALIDRGFRHTTAVAMRHPHHLAPLWSSRWLGVEVHLCAAGVTVRPGASVATATELIEAGLVEPAPQLSGAALIPRLDLLVAHEVVHVLAHHPELYSHFFRLLVDLDGVLARPEGARAVAGAGSWIAPLVQEAEVGALAELVRALQRGGDPAVLAEGDGHGATLLRHFAALAVDGRYRRRWGRHALLLHDDPTRIALGRHLMPPLLYPRREVLGADGRPLSWRRYALFSVGRPFRLAARLVRFGLRGGGRAKR